MLIEPTTPGARTVLAVQSVQNTGAAMGALRVLYGKEEQREYGEVEEALLR